MGGSSYLNISGAATTVVVTGPGVLREICLNKAATSATMVIYDNTSAAGTKIASYTFSGNDDGPATGLHDVRFQNGLTIVTTGTIDVTVVYN